MNTREHTEWFEVNVEAMIYVDESGFNLLKRSRALGGDRAVRWCTLKQA